MQVKETAAFEGVGDYGYVGRVAVQMFAEMEQGEEEVLVGVEGMGVVGSVCGGGVGVCVG